MRKFGKLSSWGGAEKIHFRFSIFTERNFEIVEVPHIPATAAAAAAAADTREEKKVKVVTVFGGHSTQLLRSTQN